jgi:hypothetical protein
VFFFTGKAFAYVAQCFVHDGMAQLDYIIEVKNKVLTIEGKDKLPFIGKTNDRWYLYGNDRLIFRLGPFYKTNSSELTQFKISISYSDNSLATGSCALFK